MQVGGQTEIADAVDDAKIDGFALERICGVTSMERHTVDLRRRSGVDVLSEGEGSHMASSPERWARSRSSICE